MPTNAASASPFLPRPSRAACLAERDALLAILGMDDEDRSSLGSRYAATSGELRAWARELGVAWLVEAAS